MVVALVTALSFIYLSQLLRLRINAEYASGLLVANQILHSAQDAVEQDRSGTPIDTSNTEAAHAAIAESLQTDAGLISLLESDLSDEPVLLDAAIVDRDGRSLMHTNP